MIRIEHYNQLRELAQQVQRHDGYVNNVETRQRIQDRLDRQRIFFYGSSSFLAKHFIAYVKKFNQNLFIVDDWSSQEYLDGIRRIDTEGFVKTSSSQDVVIPLAFSYSSYRTLRLNCLRSSAQTLDYLDILDALQAEYGPPLIAGLAKATADNIESFIHAMDWFNDDVSKLTYFNLLKARLTNDRSLLEAINAGPGSMYFGYERAPLKPRDVVIDGGAYDGDTVEQVLSLCPTIEAIHAFEPDSKNFQRLNEKYSGNAQVHCLQKALHSHPTLLRFSDNQESFSTVTAPEAAAVKGPSAVEVEATSLDSLALQKVDFIKLDIEGGESAALTGALHSIQTHRPRLAIAGYHKPLDLIEIPQLIRELGSHYELAVRHHGSFFLETVLYAVPSDS